MVKKYHIHHRNAIYDAALTGVILVTCMTLSYNENNKAMKQICVVTYFVEFTFCEQPSTKSFSKQKHMHKRANIFR